MPASESAPSALRLNLRIFSVVMFNFANYLTIGLPLAVLPGYVHEHLGLSAFWAGLVISLQYFTTLLSRLQSGRIADEKRPKKVVVMGLCVGRLILGEGQSFAGTGATLWGVGVVGSRHIGRVISWNGVATYGAMAIGAPLGVWINHIGGLKLVSYTVIAVAVLFVLLALPREAAKVTPGKKLPFREVLGKVWVYGIVLALASVGFGVIATFITLFYADRHWEGAALTLTIFSCAFVGVRLLFPNSINRFGGLRVAIVCFTVEITGLLLIWGAALPLMAELGAFLAGVGFSLVFPSLGVLAVKVVAPQNQGSALATYTLFLDLSLGLVGPLAGVMMGYTGVGAIYLAAVVLVSVGLLMTLRLSRRGVTLAQEENLTSGQ
ncbi:MAG: MFS transporter [Symbiopectobacterium sp.]|uniref:MFS transporter n=1 Tax=Symbiopectobacterium sp. TaxID=2952789 RepID=UPI0039ECDAB4